MTNLAEAIGRTQAQTEALLATTIEVIGERQSQIFYSAYNNELARRTGQPTFDLGTDRGRWCLGALLGEVNRRTIDDIEAVTGTRALLSVLVWHKDSDHDDFGKGFYKFAQELRLLPTPASDDDKIRFISEQTTAVLTYNRRRSAHRRP
jgi:hypothetical protein